MVAADLTHSSWQNDKVSFLPTPKVGSFHCPSCGEIAEAMQVHHSMPLKSHSRTQALVV